LTASRYKDRFSAKKLKAGHASHFENIDVVFLPSIITQVGDCKVLFKDAPERAGENDIVFGGETWVLTAQSFYDNLPPKMALNMILSVLEAILPQREFGAPKLLGSGRLSELYVQQKLISAVESCLPRETDSNSESGSSDEAYEEEEEVILIRLHLHSCQDTYLGYNLRVHLLYS
jgi:hypothetical protein